MIYNIFFWIIIIITIWLGFRNLITIITGFSQVREIRPGQRGLHLISLLIFWLSSLVGIFTNSIFYPILGIFIEYVFRHWVIKEGYKQITNKKEI